MPRTLTIGVAQSGPVPRTQSRADVLGRLIDMLRQAARSGCRLVTFTECALTPFFPHWWIDDDSSLDAWFEWELPGQATQPLFDEAKRLRIGFHLGFAEIVQEQGKTRRFNSSILVGPDGQTIGKYRKIHLPGHVEHRPENPFQNLEKRYFEVGDLGFRTYAAFETKIGLCICNDRRWPETYRVLALMGAEVILLGYNTPDHIPEFPEMDRLVGFHHQLCLQAGAHQNGCWVAAAAKAGIEEGVSQIGLSAIVSPTGEIVSQSETLADELIVYECDLDLAQQYKKLFDFDENRRPENYRPIAAVALGTPNG